MSRERCWVDGVFYGCTLMDLLRADERDGGFGVKRFHEIFRLRELD